MTLTLFVQCGFDMIFGEASYAKTYTILTGAMGVYFNIALPDHAYHFSWCHTPCTDYTDDLAILSNFPMWF